MSAKTRVFVADDAWMSREEIRNLVERSNDLQVVGESADPDDALEQVRELEPDVALIDLDMPAMGGGEWREGGIELARRIALEVPQSSVLIVTVSRRQSDVVNALRAGAKGYIVKSDIDSADDLCEPIKQVAAGQSVPLSLELARPLAFSAQLGRPEQRLTARERDVLALVVEGLSNKEVADRLGLTEQSIKNYVSSLLRKLDVGNRTALAAIAQEHGMLARVEESE